MGADINLIDRALLRLQHGLHKGGYTDDDGTICCTEAALIMAVLDEDYELEDEAGHFEPGEVFELMESEDGLAMSLVAPPFSHVLRSDRFNRLRNATEEVAREQFPERLCENGTIAEFNDHPDTTLGDVTAILEKAALNAPADVLGES